MSRQQSNDFERDAELTALYRAAPAEEPPAALDDAIRAAARREVRAGPASADATRRRWYVPVSIAAVVVLSFTVVTLMKEEAPEFAQAPAPPAASGRTEQYRAPDDNDAAALKPKRAPLEQSSKNIGLKPSGSEPSTGLIPPSSGLIARMDPESLKRQKDTAASERPPAPGKPSDKSSKPNDNLSDARSPAVRELLSRAPDAQRDLGGSQSGTDTAKAAAPERQAPPAPHAGSLVATEPKVDAAPRSRAEEADTETRQRMQAFPASPAPTPAAKPATPPFAPKAESQEEAATAMRAPAKSAAELERDNDLPAEKWLERIEDLRKQGRLDEAKASLADFRKRYPDYRLPEPLRAWGLP
jgi:hypothetical protein